MPLWSCRIPRLEEVCTERRNTYTSKQSHDQSQIVVLGGPGNSSCFPGPRDSQSDAPVYCDEGCILGTPHQVTEEYSA